MKAQDDSLSFLEVFHGLGRVPDLVEILVKAMYGPNEGYIFKGIGRFAKLTQISEVVTQFIQLFLRHLLQH